MDEYNFIPVKYNKSKIHVNIGGNKGVILTYTIIYIVLIYLIQKISSHKEIEAKKLLQSENQSHLISSKVIESKPNVESLTTITSFFNDVNNMISLSEVNVKGNQIKSKFEVENEERYYNFILNIENNSKYRLLNISPLKTNSVGKSTGEVILEVVK